MAAFPDLETDEMRADIRQEEESVDMLYASTKELEDVCTDLKARYDEIDGEENDWKTRCEHQEQMNRQFSEQIEQLQSQLLQYEILLKGDMSSSSPENVDKLLGITEVTPYMVKMLERQKSDLGSEWDTLKTQLDEESKAHLAALEKCKLTETQQQNFTASFTSRSKSRASAVERVSTANSTTRVDNDVFQSAKRNVSATNREVEQEDTAT